jgi:hypothetical protein
MAQGEGPEFKPQCRKKKKKIFEINYCVIKSAQNRTTIWTEDLLTLRPVSWAGDAAWW